MASSGRVCFGRRPGQGPLTPDAPAFTLAHAAPDTELLTVLEGVLETVLADHAAATDLLGFPGAGTPLGEEQVGIHTEAVRELLPRHVEIRFRIDAHVGEPPDRRAAR